jgi:hypothetical protein
MDPAMDFQVVVLAGGTSDKLSPLVSKVSPSLSLSLSFDLCCGSFLAVV